MEHTTIDPLGDELYAASKSGATVVPLTARHPEKTIADLRIENRKIKTVRMVGVGTASEDLGRARERKPSR